MKKFLIPLMACASAVFASAAIAVPTLQEEYLQSYNPNYWQSMTECAPGGTISYSGSGAASGPYTGTYIEAGTVGIGGPHPFYANRYSVASFSASFTINFPGGTINGTLSLGNEEPVNSFVECYPSGGSTGFWSVSLVRYSATITDASGQYIDAGLAQGYGEYSSEFYSAYVGSFVLSDYTEAQPACRKVIFNRDGTIRKCIPVR